MAETIYEMIENLKLYKNLDTSKESYNKDKKLLFQKIYFIQECYKIALIKKILSLSVNEKISLISQITNINLNWDNEYLDEYLIILMVGKDYYEKYKNSFISNDKESLIIQDLLNSDSIFIYNNDFNAELFDHKIKR